MRKINCIFVIVMVLILAGTGIEIFVTKDRSFSENENRYLEERPQISLSNIGGRDADVPAQDKKTEIHDWSTGYFCSGKYFLCIYFSEIVTNCT